MRHDFLEIHATDPHGCLARAKAQLVDGLDTEGEAAKVGTAIHRCAEVVAIERAEHPAVDPFAVARSTLRDQAVALRMTAGSVADAARILETVLSAESRISLWGEPGWDARAELRWGLVAQDDGFAYVEDPQEPCIAAGTIDLLESGGVTVRVTDWKTTLQMFSAQDAYESFQLRLYLVAAFRRMREGRVGIGRLGMLRHGYYATADFVPGDPWEAGTLLRVCAEREARERALASGEYPETPGPWCSWCPVLMRCGTVRRYAEMGAEAIGALSPPEAARAWLGVRALAAKLERFVRGHVEAVGDPIPLGDPHGTVLGFHATNGWETVRDYEQTMDQLRVFGMTNDLFVEHFRFVAPQHYGSRVKKVLREVLRVDAETAEGLVVPITKSEFTTFVPEFASSERVATLEDVDAAIDRALSGG